MFNNGVLDWSYTGLAEYAGNWFYVSGGIVNWNYTGLVEYAGNWFYVSGGIVDWSIQELQVMNTVHFI